MHDIVFIKRVLKKWLDEHTKEDDFPAMTYESIEELYQAIVSQQEIVRCKDCKWHSEKGFCKHPNGGAGNIRPANWFCADGE